VDLNPLRGWIGALIVCACSGGEPELGQPVSQETNPTVPDLPSEQALSTPIPEGPNAVSVDLGPAVTREALLGVLLEFETLKPNEQELAVRVLNTIEAPCPPCERTSIARCALSMPAGCENLPGLLARSRRLISQGSTEAALAAALTYPDDWFALPNDGRPVDPPTGGPVRLEVWLDPGSPFLGGTVTTIDQLDLSRSGLVFRFFPEPGDPLAEDLSRAAIAAESQGMLEAFLRGLLSWRESNRPRGGRPPPVDSQALASVAFDLQTKGLLLERWEADRRSPETTQRLREDQALASRLSIRAVPTWFVNGYRMRGNQSSHAIARLIAQELLDHPQGP